MSDRRPCRNDEGWYMCRIRWWVADCFPGRKVFNRVSHRGRGYSIYGGKLDLDATRATITDEVRMDFRIYDEEEEA